MRDLPESPFDRSYESSFIGDEEDTIVDNSLVGITVQLPQFQSEQTAMDLRESGHPEPAGINYFKTANYFDDMEGQ